MGDELEQRRKSRFSAQEPRGEEAVLASLGMTLTLSRVAGGNPKSGRSTAAPLQGQEDLLWRLGGLGQIELLGADDAFALFDEDYLIWLDVFQRFDEAARPADFEELDGFGFADAEVDAEIILREIAATTADFVDLGVEAFLAGKMSDAFD